MMHLLALLLCVSGFSALAMAMERHQEDVLGRVLPVQRARMLRVAGWGGLLLALWLVVANQGWGLGLVSYSGHTSLAAGLVYIALLVKERRKAG